MNGRRLLAVILGGLVGLVFVTTPLARAETYEVDGVRVRVRLAADWPAAMVGEPLYLSLVIENLTSHDLFYGDGFTRNGLGRPDFIEVTTTHADGSKVEMPDTGPSCGGVYGARRLRPGERHAKRLFLPHWAVITEPGQYEVMCERTYEFFGGMDDSQRKTGPTHSIDVDLSTQITIDAADPTRMPAVIRRWEGPVRGPETDAAAEAVRALAHVSDPRVISVLRRGIASGYYEIMFVCIGALAKFDVELALEGIRMGMRVKGDDLKSVPDPKTATSLAENLRHHAAATLSKSSHPHALETLASYANDRDWRVRVST